MIKPKVAFVCVHNTCRSQMAEALGKKFAADVFESYSAGTVTKPNINKGCCSLIYIENKILNLKERIYKNKIPGLS